MANIALRAARRAGDVLAQGYEQLDSLKAHEKNLSDRVGAIRASAERAIMSVLQKTYPEHGVVGPVSGHTPGRGEGEEYLWMVEALSGEENFIRGEPAFAVSIACQRRGRIEHAVIVEPVSRAEFVASRGYGASLNNKRIRVSHCVRLNDALLGVRIPVGQTTSTLKYREIFQQLTGRIGALRSCGNGLLNLAYVAAGRYDGCWDYGLSEQDLAVGGLLVLEAGGLTGDFSGDNRCMGKGEAVCGSPKIFRQIVTHIRSSLTQSA